MSRIVEESAPRVLFHDSRHLFTVWWMVTVRSRVLTMTTG